jgi:hypothetical protein
MRIPPLAGEAREARYLFLVDCAGFGGLSIHASVHLLTLPFVQRHEGALEATLKRYRPSANDTHGRLPTRLRQ